MALGVNQIKILETLRNQCFTVNGKVVMLRTPVTQAPLDEDDLAEVLGDEKKLNGLPGLLKNGYAWETSVMIDQDKEAAYVITTEGLEALDAIEKQDSPSNIATVDDIAEALAVMPEFEHTDQSACKKIAQKLVKALGGATVTRAR